MAPTKLFQFPACPPANVAVKLEVTPSSAPDPQTEAGKHLTDRQSGGQNIKCHCINVSAWKWFVTHIIV